MEIIKSSWRRLALYLVISALITHVAVVFALPHIVMYWEFQKADDKQIFNMLHHKDVANAGKRVVVSPNPSAEIANCFYDLDKKPLLLTQPDIPGYWSWSFFSADTSNYLVINDRTATPDNKVFVLKQVDQPLPDHLPKKAQILVSPGRRGVAILRIGVFDYPDRQVAINYKLAQQCKSL